LLLMVEAQMVHLGKKPITLLESIQGLFEEVLIVLFASGLEGCKRKDI
jgi:hypothetical protein